MADVQPKFKFKKRSNASLKKKLRRTTGATTDDDGTKKEFDAADVANVAVKQEEEGAAAEGSFPSADVNSSNNNNKSINDEEEEPSSLSTILAVDRRRKLLRAGNRGVDAANLGKPTLKTKPNTESDEGDATEIAAGNQDLEERLKGTFAGGKLAGSNDMGGDDEGGILAKKHKKAMEEFIQSNMTSKDSTQNDGNDANGEKSTMLDAEKELYAELLITSDGAANKIEEKDEGEGDVGAGGTMMGGTGIAEVALPIDERIKALKATERAAMEYERAKKARFGGGDGGEDGFGDDVYDDGLNFSAKPANATTLTGMVPMCFASGPGKRKRQEIGVLEVARPDSQKQSKSQSASADFHYPVQSSAIPNFSASSAGASVQRSDISDLGASYSHNFQLHTQEWISQRREDRQTEIDAIQAQQEAEEGPAESKERVGFEMSRKMAKGELIVPGATSGKGGSLKNEWDRKKDPRSNDDRVYKSFISNSKNRR